MRFFVGHTRQLSISSRLLLWFLAIAMIPCGLLTAFIGWTSARSLEVTVKRSLLVIAEDRTEAIENLIRERRADVAVVGQLPTVVSTVNNLQTLLKKSAIGSAEYQKETTALKQLITRLYFNMQFYLLTQHHVALKKQWLQPLNK